MSLPRFAPALVAIAAAAACSGSPPADAPEPAPVVVVRTPAGGIQPQLAVDRDGGVHLLYFAGDPAHGDLFYTRFDVRSGAFGPAIQVNEHPDSAIATGTVRGGHLAIGRGGRVHVAWMGSSEAMPRAAGDATPMLYARLDDDGERFEPERNVLQTAIGLDGGGSVAADAEGRVYVAWHAGGPDSRDETTRRVWVARSSNDGQTFAHETPASAIESGACGCCGMRALAAPDGDVYMLFRSAADLVHRDTWLLTSRDRGDTFAAAKLHEWNVGACQMATYSLAASPDGVLAAWETDGEVFWQRVNGTAAAVSPPDATGARKHPVLAADAAGHVLLAWTEGTGWNRGGSLAWQQFDAAGQPLGPAGAAADVPVWSLGAVAPLPDGRFLVVH